MTMTMSEIVDVKQALRLMPAINTSMFKQLLREGKGPKHARIGNRIKFREGDVVDFYQKWKDTAFNQTKTVAPVRRTTAAKIKAVAKSMASKAHE